MINKIKNFFLRLFSFFYSKSNESEYEKGYSKTTCTYKIPALKYEKRYSKITYTYKIPALIDSFQEKSNNENIVSNNPVEDKQDSVKNKLKCFKDFDTDNKWASGRKKTKKLN